MEEKQTILAAGAGAITKFAFPGNQLERVENVKNVERYIGRTEKPPKETAVQGTEGVSSAGAVSR